MDASHLIAQILGLVYVVVGVGVLLNPARYKKLVTEFTSNVGLGYIGGVLALVAGYLIVTFGPGVWEVSYEGLITLIGWLALIKGVVYLVRPDLMKKWTANFSKNVQSMTVVCLVLGLALSYYGYLM